MKIISVSDTFEFDLNFGTFFLRYLIISESLTNKLLLIDIVFSRSTPRELGSKTYEEKG